jgi:DNA polymerase elongation subunit (family B)
MKQTIRDVFNQSPAISLSGDFFMNNPSRLDWFNHVTLELIKRLNIEVHTDIKRCDNPDRPRSLVHCNKLGHFNNVHQISFDSFYIEIINQLNPDEWNISGFPELLRAIREVRRDLKIEQDSDTQFKIKVWLNTIYGQLKHENATVFNSQVSAGSIAKIARDIMEEVMKDTGALYCDYDQVFFEGPVEIKPLIEKAIMRVGLDASKFSYQYEKCTGMQIDGKKKISVSF